MFNKHNQLFFFSCLAIISIIKIIIISHNEIIAYNADPKQYVELAYYYYWGRSVLPFRPAGYPLWLALICKTGLPLRLTAEFLLLFSCFVFSYTLKRIAFGPAVCCMAFLLMVFHPFSFGALDLTIANTFYTPVLILALSFAFLAINSASQKRTAIVYSCISSLCFAIIWNTREETILILIALILILLSKVALCFYNKTGVKDCFKSCLLFISPLITVLLIINLAVYSINYYKYNYWGQGSPTPKWIKSALTALTSIKPSQPIRRAAITKEAREMAYRVSPTFAKLKPYIEIEAIKWTSASYVGVEEEIGSGHFLWVLRLAIGRSGYDAKKKRDIYLNIANEINNAINKEIIPGRLVFVNPLIDPSFKTWLPHLPKSVKRNLKLFVNEYKPIIDNHRVLPENTINLFNRIANRRTSLLKRGPMQGRAFVEGHKIERVELRPTRDKRWHRIRRNYILSSTLPDQTKKQSMLDFPFSISFKLPALLGRYALNELSLVLCLQNGSEIVIKSPHQGRLITYEDLETELKCYYSIDNFPLGLGRYPKILYKIQTIIGKNYGKVLFWLSVLGIPIALAIIAWLVKVDSSNFIGYLFLGNILLIILSSVTLFAVIDASAWPASPRYLFASMVLYSGILAALLGSALQGLMQIFSKSYFR